MYVAFAEEEGMSAYDHFMKRKTVACIRLLAEKIAQKFSPTAAGG